MNRPSIGETEISAVTDCLRSRWITTGALCKSFEEKFQALTGAKYAVSLTSGTAGMDILLTALGIGAGDEVITPSLTFASTVNMIALHGARPVFANDLCPGLFHHRPAAHHVEQYHTCERRPGGHE